MEIVKLEFFLSHWSTINQNFQKDCEKTSKNWINTNEERLQYNIFLIFNFNANSNTVNNKLLLLAKDTVI